MSKKNGKSLSKKSKIAILVISIVFLVLALNVAIFNIYFSVIGKREQIGVAVGETWSATDSYDTQKTQVLQMNDTDYKILVLTDIHLKNHGTFALELGMNYLLDWSGAIALNSLVKKTDPDLILVLGDTVLTQRNDIEYERFIKTMDSYKKPWACVFGNHDDEGRADKNKLVDLLLESEYGLFSYGPQDMHGAGNYVLELKRGEETPFALFMMDTGSSTDFPDKKDGINEKQVEWYNWNMQAFNAKYGSYPQNMSFFHIPLPMYSDLNNFEIGKREEKSSVANTDAGLFDAMLEKNGKYIMAGHDHNNNFIEDVKGIKLGYAMKSSYNCYIKLGMTGGTLITIDKENKFTSKVVKF